MLALIACSPFHNSEGNGADAGIGQGPRDSGPEPSADAGRSDAGDSPSQATFTHKMFKTTGENMFAKLAYECVECNFEHLAAINPPAGWSKGPTQILLPVGEMRSRPSFEGVPDAMDFVPEVPGNEYLLIAKTLEGRLVETGANGLFAVVQVMRDTVLRYPAGQRIHELTDPEDNSYVLFVYEVDPRNVNPPDFQAEDALADFSGPEGWSYSTRVLEEELALDTPDIATVLAARSNISSAWQKRD